MLDVREKIGVVDLFCGVGGLTYGLRQSGLDVVAGVDLDSSCKFAYSYNNKASFIEKSVADVSGDEIKDILDGYDVQVIAGCAPCQPFSSHQKDKKHRQRHKDWGLLYEFARIAEEAKPHIISMENVPELQREKVFEDFVNRLVKLGYKVDYKVVNAAKYGVPQRRRRLLLLASRIGVIELLTEAGTEEVTVRDTIGHLPEVQAGVRDSEDVLHFSSKMSEKNLSRIQASVPGGSWKDWPEHLKLECHKKDTGSSYKSVYGRMCWDDVAPTITTQFINYGTGRFGHPEQNRALTLREGALLQSFPQDYQFVEEGQPIVMGTIAKHIGNAVPPKLGELIGASIRKHISDMMVKTGKSVVSAENI